MGRSWDDLLFCGRVIQQFRLELFDFGERVAGVLGPQMALKPFQFCLQSSFSIPADWQNRIHQVFIHRPFNGGQTTK